ncbi:MULTISPECIES: hypothetical protein [unclassified Pseudofrankia]|uniref:hypothetical protein n=1 Tax=unclassified Pseudofrankia TaxID=2994372 RepID=UPI00104207EA|nr:MULTISPECIES: hypothetical protein [unclassified Pseudofrankia]MDT3444960.1 hypothetical protein [Pseudofrankia sp. BMG5.37]
MDGLGLGRAAGDRLAVAGDLDGLDSMAKPIPARISVAFTVRRSTRPWPRLVVRAAVRTWDQGRAVSWATSVGWFP